MQKGVSADMSFALQAGDQEVYLVVVATPDEFQSIFWDQRYHTIYRYPYKVQLTGAWPDGQQPGYQLATAQKYPAGHTHSNGGGWVADGAKVDATAYVGPFAAVLGGSVLGNARIEDYAAIWNGTVKDNAVVGGLSQMCDAVTASGSAEIRSVVACNFEWWNTVITGNAKLFGDLFVHLGSTPATTGAYSGAVYGGTLSQPEMGSTKNALPVEVTAPIPAGWPSDVKVAKVVGVGSSRCLDVPGLSQTNGVQTTLWDCNGGANQAWSYTTNKELKVYGSKCLDAYGLGKTNGTKVVIWECTGGANQKWNVNANGTVTDVNSGLCLDANGWGTKNGTALQLWACHGGTNQQWKLN